MRTPGIDRLFQIMMERDLRSQPFSDTILREMAIRSVKSKYISVHLRRVDHIPDDVPDTEQMLDIPGIDPDKVARYGAKFLRLVRNSQKLYEDMMRSNNEVVPDPNHRTVINIIDSDDEYSSGEELFNNRAPENHGTTTSRYFAGSNSASNGASSSDGVVDYIRSAAYSTASSSRTPRPSSSGRSGTSGSNSTSSKRRATASSPSGKTARKQKKSGHRPGTSSGSSAKKSSKAGSSAPRIGMMPT